ncbi:FAD/NAD(P)-binding domain-containing protein [Thozetella sp. PMI_491]|nr:FAD/NAD(P)-binding domain-containing protein [Thozetella sp. PMI_491]
MDAYSISVTSPSQRNSSRIYQDLKAAQSSSVVDVAASVDILARYAEFKNRMEQGSPHIGVIGAGLAGLRCADVLLGLGFQVTILEARDRIGGRLHQEELSNGHWIDVGPNWIHGTVDNPMMELAKETNTRIGRWDSEAWTFDESGKLLPLEASEACAATMWDIIKEAFEYSNKHCQEIDSQKSLFDYFEEKVAEHVPETTTGWQATRHTVLQMSRLWGAFVGSPITKQSLKYFWLEECLDGENLFCAGTYKKILEKIAAPARLGADIVYGAKVTEIYGKSAGTGNNTVNVIAANSRVFEFDEVVATLPLGWLKKHLRAFVPPLPSRLAKAIQAIGYGCLEKVYISFPKAFWLKPGGSGRKFQGFCQWLAPEYAANTNPQRWTNEVVELASLSPADAHPTLLFYIYGEESQHITSRVASCSAKDEKDAFLFDFFRPYYSRLPQYDPTNPDCQPTGSFATDWLNDEFAGNGSYSNFQVGLEEGDADLRAMREGIPAEGIWLAGEHTAPFVALGTATGAYWSGDIVARRLARAYGRSGEVDAPLLGRE